MPLLDHFDAYFERHVKDRTDLQLQLEHEDGTPSPAAEAPSSGSGGRGPAGSASSSGAVPVQQQQQQQQQQQARQPDPPFPSPAVLEILRVTTLILEGCSNKHLYNSYEVRVGAVQSVQKQHMQCSYAAHVQLAAYLLECSTGCWYFMTTLLRPASSPCCRRCLQYLSLLLAAPDAAVVLATLQTLAAFVRKSSSPAARCAPLAFLLPAGCLGGASLRALPCVCRRAVQVGRHRGPECPPDGAGGQLGQRRGGA